MLFILEVEVVVIDEIGCHSLVKSNPGWKASVVNVITGSSVVEGINLENYYHLVERSPCTNQSTSESLTASSSYFS